jgi:hypothetical protein
MKRLILLFLAVLFSQLFYDQQIGINLLIYEAVVFGILIYHNEVKLHNKLNKLIFGSVWLSLFLVIYHHSLLSIIIHCINWVALIGLLNHIRLKKLLIGLGIGIISIFQGPKTLFKDLRKHPKSGRSLLKKINFKLYILPIIILLIFQGFYRLSNPDFDAFASKIWGNIFDFFSYFDWTYLPLFLLGLLISIPILFRVQYEELQKLDAENNESLLRIRRRIRGILHPIKLKYQYKSALFLFFTLNMLIALFLTFEIYYGWINFHFTGQNLSTYVHQGTYILILSILISMGLVLYYFKGNLNFLSFNKPLISQTNIWIILNALLTFSVAIRCYHYIDHFGLTQKRIGVMTFLLAVIIGLITIYIKVNQLKTSAYLWRVNILSIYLIFNALTLFNWDVIIAKYNIFYHDKIPIELSYLRKLSDKTLFIYNTNDFEIKYYHLSSKTSNFQYRMKRFIEKEDSKHWLSWNYADYSCYQQLKGNSNE